MKPDKLHVEKVYTFLRKVAQRGGAPTTYEEALSVIGISLDQGHNYIRHLLEVIFVKCDDRKLPPLTAIVIGVNTIKGRHGLPGSGYFVAEACSKNQAGRYRQEGYQLFHPDNGFTHDQLTALSADYEKMAHRHQDSVWVYTGWPETL